jgi:hypothetical protein
MEPKQPTSHDESTADAAGYEAFVHLTVRTLFKTYGAAVHASRQYCGRSGHNHQIDVSVDLNIATFRILILFECKHYRRRVGVEDLFAFTSRLSDIGAHKGVMVSTVGFQKGAKKIAMAHNIALVIALHCKGKAGSSWKILLDSGLDQIPSDRSEELQDHHNEGEKDAAEYNGYNPPRGIVESILSSAGEEYQEDDEPYDKGWENGSKQVSQNDDFLIRGSDASLVAIDVETGWHQLIRGFAREHIASLHLTPEELQNAQNLIP